MVPPIHRSRRLGLFILFVQVLIFVLGIYLLLPPAQQSVYGPPPVGVGRPISFYLLSVPALVFYVVMLLLMLYRPPYVTDREWGVLEKLSGNPGGMTIWALHKQLKMHEKTVERLIRRLRPLFVKVIGLSSKGGSIYALHDYVKGIIQEGDGAVEHIKADF